MIPIRSIRSPGAAAAEQLERYEFTIPAGGVSANTAISPLIAATDKLLVHTIYASVHGSTSVVAGIRVGFGATTLPATSGTANTPATGILLSHPGALAGTVVHGIPGLGALGEELRVTATAPTAGSIVIVFLGELIKDA